MKRFCVHLSRVVSVRREEHERGYSTTELGMDIAPHAGVVKSVLRLFDELAKCDEEGILKDVRKAAEGVE